MFRLTSSLILVAVMAAFLVTGCGRSKAPVLAVVDDYEISLDEFRDNTPEFLGLFSSAQEEFDRKRQLLDSMITIRLLVQAAYEKNIDQTEEVKRVVAANYENSLLDALYNKHIASKVSVSESEVRDHYDKLAYQLRASHILLSSEDTANMLFERLKNGENFDELTHEYSVDNTAKHNYGDLGYFTWGTMVDEFEQTVFAMEPGEISTPVKSRFGYHIIKLVDKKPNRMRRNFKQMREEIRQKISAKRRFMLAQDYFRTIEAKYPITLDSSVADYIMHKRQALYPPQVLERMPKNDFDEQHLDRNEMELVLATWEGGSVTMLDYLLEARTKLPPQTKPDFDDYDSLLAAVFELKKSEILALEATSEGLENSEFFKRKIEQFKEHSMAVFMRNDSIPEPPPPRDKDVLYYYNNNKDEFAIPAKIHLYEILISDELLAQKLAMEITSLQQFKEKASELTERPGMRAKSGDLGFIEKEWSPDLFDAAWGTTDQTVGGPIVAQGKYSVIMPVERTETVYKDFLEVRRDIEIEVNKKNRQEEFEAWVEDRKAMTDIEVYDDVIWETIDREAYTQSESDASSQP